MTLSSGARLGPYEILAPLGAGGMGEVYRARDSRLAREVAIKVLPAALASDPERLKRFEKEAKSASALNHPNIVTVYDIGASEGISYIAMELVSGETLRALLAGGALPIKKLFSIAVQVAEGLAKAHESGIVHRDLKPENVMVTKDGLVKILDFGLAKLTSTMSGSDEGSNLPTMTGTTPGVVVGTVGYMSPEQASGHAVDFRSDQFAFGSILYEMATGSRAFQKKTAVETLSAIIRDEPKPMERVNPRTPAPLCWFVARCLAKEPDGRYASTRDLARELAGIRDRPAEVASAKAAGGFAGPRRLLASVLAGLALAACGAGFYLLGRGAASREAPRFQILTLRRGLIASARFSSDGRTVVYGAGWEGKPVELFSQQPPSLESRSLGLPPASVLAISSTGEIAISLGCRFQLAGRHSCIGTLARASLSGGAARELLERVHQADWSPDGQSLAVVRRDDGGGVRLEFPIGKVLRKSGWIGQPRISPRGDAIAFFEMPAGASSGSISEVDTRTGQWTSLSAGWRFCEGLAWSAAGDEVWFTGFQETDLQVANLYAVSTRGRLRAVHHGVGALRLHDIARDGRVLLTLDSIRAGLSGYFPGDAAEHDYSWFGFSIVRDLTPDGRFLLFNELEPKRVSHFFRRTDGSAAVSLGDAVALSLSPDANWIAAFVARSGQLPQLAILPTGPGDPRPLPNSTLEDYDAAAWLPDGKSLALWAHERGHRSRCYLQAVDGGEARPVTPEGTGLCLASPDGRLLMAEEENGKKFIFPLEGGESVAVATFAPDDEALQWSSDSAGLYVRKARAPGRIERVDLRTGQRSLVRDLTPADPAGLLGINEVVLTPGGRFYAYSTRRVLSELYVVEGLR